MKGLFQRFAPETPVLLVAAAVVSVFASSGCEATGRGRLRTERHAAPDRGYDVAHYALDIDLLPAQRRIEATCEIRFTSTTPSLEQVELDLVGLEVLSVRDASGTALPYTHDRVFLVVDLDIPLATGESSAIFVSYAGTPKTGLWFSGQREDGSGPSQVFTQGQASQTRGWMPCLDHPSDRATTEIRVTMPAGWKALGPGERVAVTEEGATRTEHWQMPMPHSVYLTSLVAGELVVQEEDWQGTPLLFAAEPRYVKWLEASFNETDDILSFLSDYTGVRYPYAKYSQAIVANFPWGGMENISATTLTPLTLDDERGNLDDQSHGLVAHEAAHQWFGDLLTCDDWSHIWLNEGFATYMTQLYFEETRGVDTFRAKMRDMIDEYTDEDRGAARRPMVTSVYKEPEDLFDTRTYQGAAARLNLLRFVLGDEDFRAGVRTYVAENAGRNVVTEDLKEAMEKVSGKDLDTFFAQWIYGRGYPEFAVEWKWDRGTVELSVRQEQTSVDGTPKAFETPCNVEIFDASGTAMHRIRITKASETFDLPAAERPLYVRFDSGGWIPKRIRVRKTASEWVAIANSDRDVNGRRDAVRALGELAKTDRPRDTHSHASYVSTVANRLMRDESEWVRADAARALGVAGGFEARERLVQASGEDQAARVRVAALEALRAWGENEALAEVGRLRFDAGFSYATMAAAAGLVCSADPDGAYAWLTSKLFIDSPHDQLTGMLLEKLGTLDDPAVPEQLLRWARDRSLDPNARGMAVLTLAKQDRSRATHARNISPFLEEDSFRLRFAAVDALASLGDSNARQALKEFYPDAPTARERRTIEAALAGRR